MSCRYPLAGGERWEEGGGRENGGRPAGNACGAIDGQISVGGQIAGSDGQIATRVNAARARVVLAVHASARRFLSLSLHVYIDR